MQIQVVMNEIGVQSLIFKKVNFESSSGVTFWKRSSGAEKWSKKKWIFIKVKFRNSSGVKIKCVQSKFGNSSEVSKV